MKERLAEYKANLDTLCTAGFPDIADWTSKVSDAEIGMQLRVVAILLANGVAPKVFQVCESVEEPAFGEDPSPACSHGVLRHPLAMFLPGRLWRVSQLVGLPPAFGF